MGSKFEGPRAVAVGSELDNIVQQVKQLTFSLEIKKTAIQKMILWGMWKSVNEGVSLFGDLEYLWRESAKRGH